MNEIECDNIRDGSVKTESGRMGRIINPKHEPGAVEKGAARIDRRARWDNPFPVGRDGDQDQVIARYRADLRRRIRAAGIWPATAPPRPATAKCSHAPRPGRPRGWARRRMPMRPARTTRPPCRTA